MGKPELENLAIKLSNELNGLANVIPGMLNLNVYFLSVLDATEIKKYVSAETTASTRPGPVMCGELESAWRVPVAR